MALHRVRPLVLAIYTQQFFPTELKVNETKQWLTDLAMSLNEAGSKVVGVGGSR